MRELLRKHNVALLDEIKRREKFQNTVREASEDPMEKEESTLPSSSEGAGWRVDFEGGGPSFFFHPLTRGEFDATMEHFDAEMKTGKALLSMVGTLFGGEVRKAPLVTASDGKSLVVRTRVSKRLRCSPENVVHQAERPKPDDRYARRLGPSQENERDRVRSQYSGAREGPSLLVSSTAGSVETARRATQVDSQSGHNGL